jgi:predicted transcriptional regulator
MPRPFLKSMDSFEVDSRFSTEQGLSSRYQDMKESNVQYDEMRPFLSRLPLREVDLIELYYNHGKNQKDIAKMFGVTQGAVSSRLSRARTRLKFLSALPKISNEEIDASLCKYFGVMELEIIKTMIQTTCQSKTAQLLNLKFGLFDEKKRMTQVKVRHRFEKCIAFLREEMKSKPEMKKFHDLLVFIKENLYKIHEVILPHFNRLNKVVFSMEM